MTDKGRNIMNREILFRGKRLQGSDWVYGYLFKSDINKRERESGIATLIFTPDCDTFIMVPELHNSFMVVADTIGQYTGLTDRNGKKIFEGDIVEYHTDYDGLDGFTKEVDVRAVFVWDKDCCSFGCIILGGDPDEFYPWFDMREEPPMAVIGNIHDNPELLGTEE